MLRVIHVLQPFCRSPQWAVRSDGLPERVFANQASALEQAREQARLLARRDNAPIAVRIWQHRGGYQEEICSP